MNKDRQAILNALLKELDEAKAKLEKLNKDSDKSELDYRASDCRIGHQRHHFEKDKIRQAAIVEKIIDSIAKL